MSKREITNLPASIHRRLLNKAREEGRPLTELLRYYAMERFLYRLSRSTHASEFVLKGALMMLAWEAPLSRTTSDIDILGLTRNDEASMVSIIRDVCQVKVVPDGLDFDAENIRADTITDAAEYVGLRVRLVALLGSARIPVQIDIGFGDPVVPRPETYDYPVLLDLPGPRLSGYSMESLIAEKLEPFTHFGMLNSRLKDIYDIWLLASRHEFKGEILSAAIEATFSNRGRDVVPGIIQQIETYGRDEERTSQWDTFTEKNDLVPAAPDLRETTRVLAEFLKPIMVALASGGGFKDTWPPGGPWDSND